jgi:hypothetical protein
MILSSCSKELYPIDPYTPEILSSAIESVEIEIAASIAVDLKKFTLITSLRLKKCLLLFLGSEGMILYF